MQKEYLTFNSRQTQKIGKLLAEKISKTSLVGKAFVIALEGDLGAGKTTFVQGFAKGLGIKEKILSPTFVILKKFKIRKNKDANQKFKTFYHIDCYRIENSEILGLEFKETIFNPQNIVVIEWANKIKRIMPKNAIWIKFKFIDEKTRKIIVKNRYG